MRRIILLSLGVLLAADVVGLGLYSAKVQRAPSGYKQLGDTASYRTLGEVAVQHEGRIKPLDTYARLMVKQVYTREIIKLTNAEGETFAKWEPLAAYLDWQARPDFWNEQEIIAVEYPPLRHLVLAKPAKDALNQLAETGKLSATDKAKVLKAAEDPNVSFADLKAAAALGGVPEALATELKTLAHKIHPDQKWLAYNDLEEARIQIEGREIPFRQWISSLVQKNTKSAKSDSPMGSLDKKALESAERMHRYASLRDGNPQDVGMFDLFLTPRPIDAAYLKFTSDAVKKITGDGHGHDAKPDAQLTALEDDATRMLATYDSDIKSTARHLPGTNAEFDAKYSEWLREKSAWVPLRVLQASKPEELKAAGFDVAKVEVLKKAFSSVIENEKKAPGTLPTESASAFLAAARDLGESTSVPYFLARDIKAPGWGDLDSKKLEAFDATRKTLANTSSAPSPEDVQKLLTAARTLHNTMVPYPSVAEMRREVSFNTFAPFYKAPMAYAAAMILLLLSLGVSNAPKESAARKIELGLYGLGMASFIGGIVFEIIGFYYRVRISGWAPVTNMYETVVWVALVTSVLGLALELIYRKTYSALAASGVALLATLLAANVSLLDPNIHSLAPVLRSNYWLTIHVLTIVSSYAAFALAMGLGMLGIGYYLTATYRRDVPYLALAKPLLPFLPMLAIGVGGLIAGQSAASSSVAASPWANTALGGLALIGLMGTIVGLFGLIGELCSRASLQAFGLGVMLFTAGTAGVFGVRYLSTPTWWPQTISLLAVPGITIALGLAVILLSQLGAAARAVMVNAMAEKASQEFAEIATTATATASSTAYAKASAGSVATMAKPTVAEIRARQEASRPTIDPRALAMQSTAGRIKPLSNFTYRAMQVGVLLVAAGTILGGVWADVSWGRFWGWDAKEVWALITLLVYLVPLHGRFAGWVNTFTLMCASVVCFASVLMAWYGVNFVLATGLHSYGFVEGGGQGVVLTASLAVLAIVAATSRRRGLASVAV